MRELQPIEQRRLECLTRAGLRFGLLEPTGTALLKSIIDAIAPFRDFLRRSGVHDYGEQRQGEEHKVQYGAKLLVDGNWKSLTATFYRPVTKSGDPRVWFTRLGRFVGAGNILAVIVKDKQLYLINLSRTDVERDLEVGPLSELVDDGMTPQARELLQRLRNLSVLGSITAVGRGDTTVGMTIEHALGVVPNSSREPDYKGIELKAGRKVGKTRSNLFAQVADWDLSGCSSSDEILSLFGYFRDGVERLYCTVSARSFNAQGLKFELNHKKDRLLETSLIRSNVATWRLSKLRERLLEKHPETFWIDVESVMSEGVEAFRLKSVSYTRDPNAEQLGALLDSGVITMDHLIKRHPSGSVREKGPIFKIKKKHLGMLFPPPKTFSLVTQ